MTSLEQAEALANKLGLEPESDDDDYLETIQKHMEAFAREEIDRRENLLAACEAIADGDEGWEKLVNECLVTQSVAKLREANREFMKDKERLGHMESLSSDELDRLIVDYWTSQQDITLRDTIDEAIYEAALAKERTE